MTIYDKFDDVILEVAVDDESHRYREICGEQYVRLQFSLAEHKDIPVGSYIVIDSERYTLLDPQNIKMRHTREYEYVVIFDAEQAKLKLYKFYNIVDKRLQFPLTAKPHEHLQMLVDVLALRDGAWAMGDCIVGGEVAISYNHLSCYEALELMAQTLNTEWEIVGNTISLHKVGYNQLSPLALSYGEGNGFVSGVSRTNYGDNKPLAVVYTQGGERNIDPSKYGSSTLLLPKSKTIKYDGSKFEGEVGYNATKAIEYVSNIYGTAVARFMPNGNIAEGSVDCTEIYPKRESEVTEVVVADATKSLYGIVDSTIPESLDFEDYRIEGEKMFVAFQSGMLAGKEFEAIYKHTAIGFNKARRFEIVPQVIDGQTMPSGAYIPAVGDKYAVLGIALPDAYIADDATKTGASWDMMRKAVRYLAENECPQYTFSGTLDKIWAKRNWESIAPYMRCGAHIAFTNEAYQPTPMNVRVESIKEFINNPHAPELGLSDKTVKATMRLDAMLHNSKFAIANVTTRNDALRRSVIIKNDLAATNKALDNLIDGYDGLSSWQQGFMGGIPEDTPKGISNGMKVGRDWIIVEKRNVESDSETIDEQFSGYLAEWERYTTSNDEVYLTSDGQEYLVRGENEAYDKYITAKKSYVGVLDNVRDSNIGDLPPDDFDSKQKEYYKAREKVLIQIAKKSNIAYLQKVFGAKKVLNSDAAILASLVGVQSALGEVKAGLYGGGAEILNKEGYSDEEHGILMLFAGAPSAEGASNSKFRVYEDGTLYANKGVFGGIIMRSKTTLTPETMGLYIKTYDDNETIKAEIDLTKTGSYIELNGFKDCWVNGVDNLITITLPYYDGSKNVDKGDIDNMLSMVGTEIIIKISSDVLEGLCFNVPDVVGDNDDIARIIPYCAAMQKGDILVAQCVTAKSHDDKMLIGWNVKRYKE